MINFKDIFQSREKVLAWYNQMDGDVSESYPLGVYLDSIADLPKRVAVDLGANVGMFSRIAAHDYEEVHAFEPSHFLSSIMCYNQHHAESHNNIYIHKLAAAKNTGMIASLYRPKDCSPGDCTIQPISEEQVLQSENCLTIALEDIFTLIDHDYIDYMKIDIEGSEYDFLLDKDLSKIAIIAMEIHGPDQELKNKLYAHLGKYMHVWKYLDDLVWCLNKKYDYKIEPRGYCPEEDVRRPLEKLH
tara:strand:- start:157 stop:888 length:732 start_codon:yes stop_codon:yes gene_type:complete